MKGSAVGFQISNLNLTRPVNFSVWWFKTGGRNDWLGIEMRCAVCAAAKAQNFSSKETVATNRPVLLKSAALSRRGSTALHYVAERRWLVMANSFAKSRRS